MIKEKLVALGDWADDRTGWKKLVHESLYENIPGGSRWRYVTGSMLVFAFVTQVVTGIFLWMCYSAGSQNAWESVFYIQNEMQGGWLLRGVHHFMAQAMVVLLPIHMLQVIIDKAYLGPREFNFWTGMVLMLLVLGLGLTGYLLPWDQKGYWATKVATNLASLTPLVGPQVQKLVVGGSEYGHATLTRFFALHAGVLPGLVIAVLGLHLALFRKHGITAHSSDRRPDEYFWPNQVLKDSVACLILLVIVLVATVHGDVVGAITFDLPEEHQGAELGAPADPSEPYDSARPEWYFLFLFQLLKKFHSEFVGAIVVPGVIMAFLFAMPLTGRWKHGHTINVVVFLGLFVGAGYLTYEAMQDDNYHKWVTEAPSGDEALAVHKDKSEASQKYWSAVDQAKREYHRVKELVEYYGISRAGAIELQRNDPETQGPRLFGRYCASCHSYRDRFDEDGSPVEYTDDDWKGISAPNLKGFATDEWFNGLLDAEQFVNKHFFGTTAPVHNEESEMLSEIEEMDKDDAKAIAAAMVAEAKLVWHQEEDAKRAELITRGRMLINDNCTGCHKFGDEGEIGSGYPDLTEYGTAQWLKEFIANPEHDRFYGEDKNDRMPQFAAAENPSQNLLNDHELNMLVRWLRGDDRYLGGKKPEPKEEESKE